MVCVSQSVSPIGVCVRVGGQGVVNIGGLVVADRVVGRC